MLLLCFVFDLPVDCVNDFSVPAMITLQPNETSATVNIVVLEDLYPEDNETFTIAGQYGNPPLSITILDNDSKFIETTVTSHRLNNDKINNPYVVF